MNDASSWGGHSTRFNQLGGYGESATTGNTMMDQAQDQDQKPTQPASEEDPDIALLRNYAKTGSIRTRDKAELSQSPIIKALDKIARQQNLTREDKNQVRRLQDKSNYDHNSGEFISLYAIAINFYVREIVKDAFVYTNMDEQGSSIFDNTSMGKFSNELKKIVSQWPRASYLDFNNDVFPVMEKFQQNLARVEALNQQSPSAVTPHTTTRSSSIKGRRLSSKFG